jgi:hypothetical protein
MMEELKHDPYSDAGSSSVVMYDDCGLTEQGRAHVEELMEREKAEGLQLADDLFRRFGSHERLPELLDLAHKYEGWAWLWALGELWTGFDNISIHGDQLFAEVFERAVNGVSGISQLMSDEEQAAFDALPEEIVIYRGCGTRNEFGFSWSLDHAVAAKFPFHAPVSSRPANVADRANPEEHGSCR